MNPVYATPKALEDAFHRFANFRILGQGGEGAVFSVWDRVRRDEVALKLMRDSGEADLRHRFEREYRILAASARTDLYGYTTMGRWMYECRTTRSLATTGIQWR